MSGATLERVCRRSAWVGLLLGSVLAFAPLLAQVVTNPGVTGPSSMTTQVLFTGWSTATCNTAQVANVGVGETDLCIYPMPANTLGANGQKVRITTWGSYANNANAKSIRLYFGTTLVGSRTAETAANVPWMMTGLVTRTGAATQNAFYSGNSSGAGLGEALTSPVEAVSAAVNIRVTGQSAIAGGDVTLLELLVERLP